MRLAEFQALIANITYKPNITIAFDVPRFAMYADAGYLRIRAQVPDVDDPTKTAHISAQKVLTLDDLDGFDFNQAVRWIRNQVTDLEMHERDEFFKVCGLQVKPPHYPDSIMPEEYQFKRAETRFKAALKKAEDQDYAETEFRGFYIEYIPPQKELHALMTKSLSPKRKKRSNPIRDLHKTHGSDRLAR